MSSHSGSPKSLLIHVHNRKRIHFNISGIFPMLPLGIATLGASLEAAGFAVDLLDLSLPENFTTDVGRFVADGGYDFVGLSVTVFSLPESVELVQQIKAVRPKVRLALGGPATVFDAAALFRYMPKADAIVFGEGDRAVVDLARTLNDDMAAQKIPGVAWQTKNGVIQTAPAPPMDLDELPLPARHLLPQGRYKMHPPFDRYPPITLIESARGCPYNCAFCSLPKQYRARSVAHVMREVTHVIQTEGVREIHFVDPTFTADLDRSMELARALAKTPVRFSFKTRIDRMNADLLFAMKNAGCFLISYGVESFKDEDLDYLNKSVERPMAEKILRQTHRAGIDSMVYLLIGSPSESFGSVRNSVKKLIDSGCDFALFSDLFPDPATPITADAVKCGLLTDRQVEQFYFEQIPLPGDRALSGLPLKQVKRWVLWAFVLFYFSPRTLWRMLRKPQNIRDFLNMAKAGFHLIADIFVPRRTIE
jgi:radical SAM superfamily enzyme YgiQ (UPF0313 family)